MSNIDTLLEQLKREKTSKPIEEVKIVNETSVKNSFPWLNIVLIIVVIVMGYFLWSTKTTIDDDIIVNNVAEQVEKYENLYSTYKGQSYQKLAELVLEKQINNRSQLLKNAQVILEEARKQSLGKLDELDNKSLPEESFEEDRDRVVSYLKAKSEGYIKAGK
jgi:hypothetical protein